MFGGHRSCGSGIIKDNFSCDLPRPSDQRVLWLCTWKLAIVHPTLLSLVGELANVSYHPAKFCGHRHWVRGDIMMIKWPSDLMVGTLS